VVAEQLPGARVVKAFNTLPAAVLSQDPRTNLGRRVLFVSGDDVDAVRVVEKLAEDIGFAVIALGAIAEGGLLQQFGGPLIVHNLIRRT
jgi:predicted dinucleotide-binding enzyme